MKVRLFYKDVSGSSGAEYGILLACIAVAIIVAVGYLGSAISDLFNSIAAELPFH
jgi:Flp pilus assembly pilin Flp